MKHITTIFGIAFLLIALGALIYGVNVGWTPVISGLISGYCFGKLTNDDEF